MSALHLSAKKERLDSFVLGNIYNDTADGGQRERK